MKEKGGIFKYKMKPKKLTENEFVFVKGIELEDDKDYPELEKEVCFFSYFLTYQLNDYLRLDHRNIIKRLHWFKEKIDIISDYETLKVVKYCLVMECLELNDCNTLYHKIMNSNKITKVGIILTNDFNIILGTYKLAF